MQETRRTVRVDRGVGLNVRISGPPDAPGLLLHHGLASSQRIWDLLRPRLSRRHRVVTFDARGHGGSSKPSSGYGFDRVVADARAVIRATGLRRPVVVGHSWGAMVTLELAAHHPRAVRGAVLVDGGVAPLGARLSWGETKARLAPPHLAGMHVDEFRGLLRTFFADALDVTPDVEAIVLSVMRVGRDGRIRPQLARSNHFRILRAIWEQDPVALHAHLRVPALAILAHRSGDPGEAEREQEKRAAVAALRAAGASTRVVWLQGIHDLPLQRPDALGVRIERFVATAVG
jgi:pimeloyl-ACP methyl ester carboxylesterase